MRGIGGLRCYAGYRFAYLMAHSNAPLLPVRLFSTLQGLLLTFRENISSALHIQRSFSQSSFGG